MKVNNNKDKAKLQTIETLNYQNNKRFLSFASKLLKLEGGLSFHKNDKGGTTKYGISLRFLQANGIDVNKDGVVNDRDVIELTKEQALELFYKYFYKPLKCDDIKDDKLAANLFDMGVNAGVRTAALLLQKLLNRYNAGIREDGIIGLRTLEAVNQIADRTDLNRDYVHERINYYESICLRDKSQTVFLNGWKNRVQNFV